MLVGNFLKNPKKYPDFDFITPAFTAARAAGISDSLLLKS